MVAHVLNFYYIIKIKKHQQFKLLLRFGVEENNVLDLKQNSYKERKLP